VVTDAELAYLAVAQALLRFHDERHWIRAAVSQVGHLFPRLLSRSAYNDRLKRAAPLLQAAMRWLATATPAHRPTLTAAVRHPDRLWAVQTHHWSWECANRIGGLRSG